MSHGLIISNNRTRHLTRIVKSRQDVATYLKRLTFISQRRGSVTRVRIAYFRCPRRLRASNQLSIREGTNYQRSTCRRTIRNSELCLRILTFGRNVRTISRNRTFRRNFTVRLIRNVTNKNYLLTVRLYRLLRSINRPFTRLRIITTQFRRRQRNFIPFRFQKRKVRTILFHRFLFRQDNFFKGRLHMQVLRRTSSFNGLMTSTTKVMTHGIRFRRHLCRTMNQYLQRQRARNSIGITRIVQR